MTERLEDVERHRAIIEDIADVVGALRAIASGQMAEAQSALDAIMRYEAQILTAITQLTGMMPDVSGDGITIIIGASQGFCGGYPARIADATSALGGGGIVVIGKRSEQMMRDLGRVPDWSADMPSSARFIPDLASAVTDQVLQLGDRHSGPIRTLSGEDRAGLPIVQKQIWPVSMPSRQSAPMPLTNLPVDQLIKGMLSEVLFVQIARAIMQGFYIENRARSDAMARAQSNLKTKRAEVEQRYRQARQEQMTNEVIELSAGRANSR